MLGPAFAKETLGLEAKDFAVVVLPLGFGIVTGILLLNSYGRYFPRRRVIEGGLIALGHPARGARRGRADQPPPPARRRSRAGLDLSGVTSLLAVVVVIAFFAGIAYGLVAIPSQTQLQEDLPEDVRGRVFGVLGMLVSVASFLPIIIVGPISDLVGTTAVIFVMAIGVMVIGVRVGATRGPAVGDRSAPGRRSEAVDRSPSPADLDGDRPSGQRDRGGKSIDAINSRDLEAVAVPGPASSTQDAQMAPPLVPERTGPADPTDRD